jgi:pilus assembly protein CpaF
MQEVFRYRQLGIDQNGRAYGQFEATGVRPTFVNRLESKGIKLPSNMFAERVLLRD